MMAVLLDSRGLGISSRVILDHLVKIGFHGLAKTGIFPHIISTCQEIWRTVKLLEHEVDQVTVTVKHEDRSNLLGRWLSPMAQ